MKSCFVVNYVGMCICEWGTRYLVDRVWLGDLDWDWDIDLVLVDAQVGDDLGPLWGDDGVGAAETDGGLVDDLVSWGGSQVAGWWGDGGSWGWHGHSWDGQGPVGHLQHMENVTLRWYSLKCNV